MRCAYLLMVNPGTNNNKYYRMEQDTETSFVALYGRVGATPMKRRYPIVQYDTIYSQKLQKRYKDVSNLYEQNVKSEYKPIEDPDVRQFFQMIEGYSNRVLKRNYSVSFDKVTVAMIREAEGLLNGIDDTLSISEINETLVKLFQVIPRRMSQVQEYLIYDIKKLGEVLDREWQLLDVMKARIHPDQSAFSEKDQTILEALDLSIEPVTDPRRIGQIKKYLSKESEGRFVRAFRVRNKKTDERFYQYMKEHHYSEKDIHYLYHGSRNENWYGLITQGPLLNPKAIITGKAFGNGIYFANRARKSIGYTSLSDAYWTHETSDKRFVAVYKVLYKNQKDVYSYGTQSLKSIAPCDAVFAHGGYGNGLINDEIIIFREDQVTLQYIIELR